MADDWAKSEAECRGDAVPREYLRETSFAHMTRMATEARSAGVEKWTVDHVKSERRYIPPKGPKLRKELRHECKALAGRYYQLLSGHAATYDLDSHFSRCSSLCPHATGWFSPPGIPEQLSQSHAVPCHLFRANRGPRPSADKKRMFSTAPQWVFIALQIGGFEVNLRINLHLFCTPVCLFIS